MHARKKHDVSSTAAAGARQSIDLPTVTHLQFLVLDLLVSKSQGMSANELRDMLANCGVAHDGPKFYQLMKRLTDGEQLESWKQQFDVGGSTVERTYYRVAANGRACWKATLEFYAMRLKANQ